MKTRPPHPSRLRLAAGVVCSLLVVLFAFSASAQQGTAKSSGGRGLIVNGSFDDRQEPFKGWVTDYAWTGNHYYAGNKDLVQVLPNEGGHASVVKLTSAGDQGTKMECKPIPFEPGYRFVCKLDVKGGPYRVYFAGYKWEPGVRPHDNPELGELRLIYKSKACTADSPVAAWKTEKLELPGVALSAQAKTHLKAVRFLTLYIWMVKDGFVDNISVERIPDPSVTF